ncbi:MAG: PaaI family thioesterase [Desulfovibrio desulfuricans]|uniref:PaaI family thioesterase n=1 Tax=Desulfovibrio sp. WGS1351 TaxID=3366814 RepID=UPI002A3ABAA3|nr:PaaI family thioesterase [Desulfovibrio desulfuricans]
MKNYVAKHDKLMHYLQMTIESASPEFARVSMPLTENHRNGMGCAHGGAIFALADVAFGAAANAGKDTGVVSLSTTIEFLRPGKSGPLVAEAHVVRRGQRIQNYDIKVFDGSGDLIAQCMAAGYQTDIQLPE